MLWSPSKILFVNGADTQTRTGDLILTKDALYHLSYISIKMSLKTKKSPSFKRALSTVVFTYKKVKTKFKAWRCPTLTWGSPTLPSALFCFTSEFGMESGGSKTLWPPSKFFNSESCFYFSFLHIQSVLIRVHQNPLGVVWLSLTGN